MPTRMSVATEIDAAPRELPWKKNIRVIPNNILNKIQNFKTDACFAFCAKKLKISDIEQGLYAHLGIQMKEGKPIFPNHIIPLAWVGKYSRWNREVREIIHTDEPKYEKSWDVDVPNYGDWSNGSHTVTWTKDVYPRTYEQPKLLVIIIEHIGEDRPNSSHVFKFTVEEVLDRTTPHFLDDLLANLNLLQENVGNHDVFETNASPADYLQTLYVNWDILPPGEREETFNRIFSGIHSSDLKVRAELREHYDFLRSLKPTNFIRGTNGFRNYFGAMFSSDLVVFETVVYGNAIYVMFEEWEVLSQKSRTELLSGDERDFVRILHTSSWKERLKSVIEDELNRRKKKH